MSLQNGDVITPPTEENLYATSFRWPSPRQPQYMAPHDNDAINSALAANKSFVYLDRIYSMSCDGSGIEAEQPYAGKLRVSFLSSAASGEVSFSARATWTQIIDGTPVNASSGIVDAEPLVVTVQNYQGPPGFSIRYPQGEVTQPESGSTKIGTVTVTVSLRSGETMSTTSKIEALRSSKTLWFKDKHVSGDTMTADMYVPYNASLGMHGFSVFVKTKLAGKFYEDEKEYANIIEVVAVPVDPPVDPDPDDPDDPDVPDVPVIDPDIPPYEPPELEYVWELRQESQVTVAMAEPDGSVLWATTETTRYNGEKDLSTETLPKKRIDDYLPQPTQVLPIKRVQADLTVIVEDDAAIEVLGPLEKSKRVQNISSEGALTAIAYYLGEQASRCSIRDIETAIMPFVSRGDVLVIDDEEWYVETASHDLSSKKSTMRVSKTPQLSEVAEVLKSTPQKVERMIVDIMRGEAAKVDNAVRAKIVAKIDYRTYDALPIGGDTPVRVNLDRAVHGDLQIGTVVLIGKPTRS